MPASSQETYETTDIAEGPHTIDYTAQTPSRYSKALGDSNARAESLNLSPRQHQVFREDGQSLDDLLQHTCPNFQKSQIILS